MQGSSFWPFFGRLKAVMVTGHYFPTEAFTKPKSLEDECRSSSAKGSNSSAWMQGELFAAGHKKLSTRYVTWI